MLQNVNLVKNKADNDFLITSDGQEVLVPGWGKILKDNPTRALTLLALVNIILENKTSPTKMELLYAVQEYQEAFGYDVLSDNSLRAIQNHLNALVLSGLVTKTAHLKRGKKKTRGAPSRPYWPVCISLELK